MSEAFHSVEMGAAENPAVLLLHGLLGSSRNILRLQEAITEAGYRTIAFDARGHGHSPHFSSYSFENLADDAFQVLDNYQIGSAHFVGHSMGGRVSLFATTRAPTRVKSLTMLDAGFRVEDGGKSEVRTIIASLPDSFASKAEASDALSMHASHIKHFLLSNLRDHGDSRFTWNFDLKGIREQLVEKLNLDQSDAWAKVQCPVLLVRGEKSEYFSKAEQDAMIKSNPNARRAVISNAGHWVHVDNFLETSKNVISFLNSVET